MVDKTLQNLLEEYYEYEGVILYDDMERINLSFGKDWGLVAHVHDEVQALVRPEYTEIFKELAIDSFEKSGKYFNLKCPLTGEARIGQNWMETH